MSDESTNKENIDVLEKRIFGNTENVNLAQKRIAHLESEVSRLLVNQITIQTFIIEESNRLNSLDDEIRATVGVIIETLEKQLERIKDIEQLLAKKEVVQ